MNQYLGDAKSAAYFAGKSSASYGYESAPPVSMTPNYPYQNGEASDHMAAYPKTLPQSSGYPAGHPSSTAPTSYAGPHRSTAVASALPATSTHDASSQHHAYNQPTYVGGSSGAFMNGSSSAHNSGMPPALGAQNSGIRSGQQFSGPYASMPQEESQQPLNSPPVLPANSGPGYPGQLAGQYQQQSYPMGLMQPATQQGTYMQQQQQLPNAGGYSMGPAASAGEQKKAPFYGTAQLNYTQTGYGLDKRLPTVTGLAGRASGQVSDLMLAELGATSEFVRATTRHMPNSVSEPPHTGFVFRPLAPSDKQIPEVNFGSTGKVIRCHRCRTYINPFVAWEPSGRRWTCNICGFVNECPQYYMGAIDETGRRADRHERKELSCGSIEIIAPADYMVRPPQPPTYLFLIDVSVMSVATGLLALVCQGIKSAINSGNMPGGQRTQIGIMTFDSSIHFYKLDSTSAQPHMVVVSSLDDVFLPLSDGILVNLAESETLIRTLLDSLPSMWSKQRVTEAATGSALKAAHVAMKQWGGKISLFMATLPTLGDLTLNGHRDAGKGASSTAEAQAALLRPLNESYTELATLMTQAQISVDLYVCPPASQQVPFPMDLPTLAPLARFTGGEVRYYPCFNAMTCGDKLREEICHTLTRMTGWEAVMRVRASRGWKLTSWFGHFYFRHSDLMVLPNCHRDQTFTIAVDLEENVVQEPYLYIQSALLYTNSSGERRIRIHTVGVPVTQNYNDVVNSMDEAATMALITHQSLQIAQKSNLADARRFLQTTCGQIYNAQAQSQAGAQPMSMLPHYTLGVLKSMAFRDMRGVTPDMRCASWERIMTLPLEDLGGMFLPRLFALHDMPEDAGTPDTTQHIILPPVLALSGCHLSQAGAYLAEDGETMILWVGKAADTRWIQDVFGVDSVDHLNPDHADTIIGTSGSTLGARVAAIINEVRSSRLPFMKLLVIRQGMPLETKFFCMMIEDRSQAMSISYSDFIQKLGVRSTMAPLGATAAPRQYQAPAQAHSYQAPSSTYQAPSTYASTAGYRPLHPMMQQQRQPDSAASTVSPGTYGQVPQVPPQHKW